MREQNELRAVLAASVAEQREREAAAEQAAHYASRVQPPGSDAELSAAIAASLADVRPLRRPSGGVGSGDLPLSEQEASRVKPPTVLHPQRACACRALPPAPCQFNVSPLPYRHSHAAHHVLRVSSQNSAALSLAGARDRNRGQPAGSAAGRAAPFGRVRRHGATCRTRGEPQDVVPTKSAWGARQRASADRTYRLINHEPCRGSKHVPDRAI